MSIPGFSGEVSVYKSDGRYRAGSRSPASSGQRVIPAIPACRNCDYILDNCARNGWRPRAVCNACAFGNCYEEPPPPNPFPDPFPPLPRF
jgi:hypothetical protein